MNRSVEQRRVDQRVAEAFNSMLRTDYISLDNVDKLNLLAQYYVDYFGYLPQILGENDQIVVGRRGTGKTTLLYRAMVECMSSWHPDGSEYTKNRTLGIYIDLSKCQLVDQNHATQYDDFEHEFVSELCDSIADQLSRYWPAIAADPTLFTRLFRSAELKRVQAVRQDIKSLAQLLQQGAPRLRIMGPSEIRESRKDKTKEKAGGSFKLKSHEVEAGGDSSIQSEFESNRSSKHSEKIVTRLTVADILRILQSLRENAEVPAIYIFIDEFSALSQELQGRFTTLLRKILGTHSGVFVKLCAITDNYSLGSSIILQRDLFEISLDLDAFVDLNDSLNQAMSGLREQAEHLIVSRLTAYQCPSPEALFESPEYAYEVLSLEAMGVPRTMGLVLQQAWNRRRSAGGRLRKSDIEFGVRYASSTYEKQLLGAAKDNIAVPGYVVELWNALLDRATKERLKESKPASHFLVQPKYEEALKYLNMFFLIHLLKKGRTTKKDRSLRSQYCFDFGICLERNLEFTNDKNILRQQRFAYDDVIVPFEQYYLVESKTFFRCPKCNSVYQEADLQIAGKTLKFCPDDATVLEKMSAQSALNKYTEEETKIIGAIRSAKPDDHLVARTVADDVGCYVQKVALFGKKLEQKEKLIRRHRDNPGAKIEYYGLDQTVDGAAGQGTKTIRNKRQSADPDVHGEKTGELEDMDEIEIEISLEDLEDMEDIEFNFDDDEFNPDDFDDATLWTEDGLNGKSQEGE